MPRFPAFIVRAQLPIQPTSTSERKIKKQIKHLFRTVVPFNTCLSLRNLIFKKYFNPSIRICQVHFGVEQLSVKERFD